MISTPVHISVEVKFPTRERGQCLLILELIRQLGGDWSIGELAQALGLDKSTVSARVYELLHDTKDLVAQPRRKDRVSGVTVRPVALRVQPVLPKFGKEVTDA